MLTLGPSKSWMDLRTVSLECFKEAFNDCSKDSKENVTVIWRRGTLSMYYWEVWQHSDVLFTVFAEPRVGTVWAGELEEHSCSHRNSRCIYSLLAGAAPIAADMLYSLLLCSPTRHSHNVAITQPQGRLRWRLHRRTAQVARGRVSTSRLAWHAQCYKWAQLLHNHCLQNAGQEGLITPSWLTCSSPTQRQ